MKFVCERVPYSRGHIRRLVKSGKFPAPIQLSESRVAWIESEVDDWLRARRQDQDNVVGGIVT